MARVAVVLAGCGVFDGTEIHEAVSLLLHLSRSGVEYRCFAPDKDQAHVVNHATGTPEEGARRNVLAESARIARGDIAPLDTLSPDSFDAVFFPGGFGAAQNLSSFAFEGAECGVDPEVERVLREFRAAEKPIGMCCIAPVIAAKVFGGTPGDGCLVTIGDDAQTAKAIGAMGSRHESMPVEKACVDQEHRLVTAPAYMYGEAPIHAVYEGIGAMVEATLALVGAEA